MEKEKTKEINIMDILFILKKHAWLIVLVAVLLAVASYVYTVTMVVPIYSSTTRMMIKELTPEAQTVYSDSTSRIMLINNCIEVLGGTEVMQAVVDDMELDMSPEQLQGCVSISSPADTQALTITAVHPDPRTAKDISDTMAKMAEEVLAKDIGVASLTVYQNAKIPTAPVSPNPIKNAVMGGFLGGFITAGIAIVIRFINNKVYTPEDAEKVLGLTLFATIPEVNENTTVAQAASAGADKE